MSKFNLLFEQSFTTSDSIVVTHNLNRRIFNIRLITTDGAAESESNRQFVEDIELDSVDPLNKLTVLLTTAKTGKVQLIAEDTIQSPYYTVEEKLEAQVETPLAGTFPITFGYGGAANTGRVLEYFNGDDSQSIPYLVIGDGTIRAASFGSSATGTCTVGIYAVRVGEDPDVLLHTITVTASNREVDKPLTAFVFDEDEIYVKIDSGSIKKPYVVIYIQTI